MSEFVWTLVTLVAVFGAAYLGSVLGTRHAGKRQRKLDEVVYNDFLQRLREWSERA